MKIFQPKDNLIERTAVELAAVWYEIGRGQGLTSKYKDARQYSRANLEKFIPKAIEHLIDCLNSPNITNDAREMIYDALMERVNDPRNTTSGDLPDIDIKKLLANLPPSQALKPEREKPLDIKTDLFTTTSLRQKKELPDGQARKSTG